MNKIAIIHLFLLGFEEEVSNFTLGLTNPSTQADLLKVDLWKEKMLLYKDVVTDPGNGIQPASSTWAKKHIFGWSDDEIRTDLLQQRMERAIGEELKNTPTVIVKTGIFDTLDKLYGTKDGAGAPAAPPGEVSEPAATDLPGGLGGGGNGSRTGSGTPGSTNTGGGAGGSSLDGSTAFDGSLGGSGVVILRYLTSAGTITIGAGLTGTTATDGSHKVTTITAGTGSVSWA